ncbi:MAG: hypothetical protein ACHQQQ_12310 [Bacteroidota bacterium]
MNVKQLTNILLALSILLQSFSSLILIAGYEINKAYITNTFCENKDKPMMHCDGKCHLKKELKEEQEKSQSPPSLLKDKKEITQFSEAISEFLFNGNHRLSSISPLESHFPAEDFHPLIFHPPAA